MSAAEENQLPKSTPREFFLQLFVFTTLYVSIISLVSLLFNCIDLVYPRDGMDLPSYLDSIRYNTAFLMIMFPVYCGVTFLVIKEDFQYPQKKQFKSRRFLVALTLFMAGLVSISTVAYTLYYFLQGEAGIPSVLKSITIIVISSWLFYYYYWDLKQNWKLLPLCVASSLLIILVIVSIGYGFSLTGSPWKAKSIKEDNAKVRVLKNLQDRIVQFWMTKKQFPETLAELGLRQSDKIDLTIPGTTQALIVGTPLDIQGTRVYKKTGELSFQLCATFKYPLSSSDQTQYISTSVETPKFAGFIPMAGGVAGSPSGNEFLEYNPKNDIWDHPAGAFCFSREFTLKKATKSK